MLDLEGLEGNFVSLSDWSVAKKATAATEEKPGGPV